MNLSRFVADIIPTARPQKVDMLMDNIASSTVIGYRLATSETAVRRFHMDSPKLPFRRLPAHRAYWMWIGTLSPIFSLMALASMPTIPPLWSANLSTISPGTKRTSPKMMMLIITRVGIIRRSLRTMKACILYHQLTSKRPYRDRTTLLVINS